MSELRRDPIVARWVIIAPDRAKRPHSSRTPPAFAADEDDPFAEGREADTPGEVLAFREPGTAPDTPGWRVRVFPNRYPALTDGAACEQAPPLPGACTPAIGAHEVIVESPQFVTCLSQLPVAQVRDVFRAYRSRLQFHRAQCRHAHGLLFKNRGIPAGATLAHTHSQLMVTPWVPAAIQEELDGCQRYYDTHGQNLFEHLLNDAGTLQDRLVLARPGFIAFCPFASRVSGETWIVPQRQASHFEDVGDDELEQLADCVREVLGRMNAVSRDLPYNMMIHSAPFALESVAAYRWHIEILPRTSGIGGFEWGAGCYINSSYPEDDAKILRSARFE